MKISRTSILEVLWFIIGGLILFIAIEYSLDNGFFNSWYYYLFSILAFTMYYLRRKSRLSKK